jgi:hypothetical protein
MYKHSIWWQTLEQILDLNSAFVSGSPAGAGETWQEEQKAATHDTRECSEGATHMYCMLAWHIDWFTAVLVSSWVPIRPFLPSFPSGPVSSLYHARSKQAKDSLIYAAASSWVCWDLRGKDSKITWSFLQARSAGISPWFHIFVDGTEHASSCEIQVSQPAFSKMGTTVPTLECVYHYVCTNNIYWILWCGSPLPFFTLCTYYTIQKRMKRKQGLV